LSRMSLQRAPMTWKNTYTYFSKVFQQFVNVIQHAWHLPIIRYVFGTLYGVSLVLFDDAPPSLNAILAFNYSLKFFPNSRDIKCHSHYV
jgi:hypothetical protein